MNKLNLSDRFFVLIQEQSDYIIYSRNNEQKYKINEDMFKLLEYIQKEKKTTEELCEELLIEEVVLKHLVKLGILTYDNVINYNPFVYSNGISRLFIQLTSQCN